MAKAVIDDLIALELVHKHNVNEVLNHDDNTAIKNLHIIPEFKDIKIGVNPLELLRKKLKVRKFQSLSIFLFLLVKVLHNL